MRLSSVRDCLGVGCRPCKRCRPMHVDGGPDWLSGLLAQVEERTQRGEPVDEKSLRTLGLSKQHLGRWFARHCGFTFGAYCRMRSLAREMGTHVYEAHSPDSTGRKKLFESLQPRETSRGSDVPQTTLLVNRLMTPLGPMVACAGDDGVYLLEFAERRILDAQWSRLARLFSARYRIGVNSHLRQLHEEINQYFAGQRKAFDVSIVDRATDFQAAVWKQLSSIPLGQTSTYQQLAVQLERPKAVRAVGRANGDNRLAILIPCHRVVGSDGSLTGYGGGLDRKKWLLDHEKKMMG